MITQGSKVFVKQNEKSNTAFYGYVTRIESSKKYRVAKLDEQPTPEQLKSWNDESAPGIVVDKKHVRTH